MKKIRRLKKLVSLVLVIVMSFSILSTNVINASTSNKNIEMLSEENEYGETIKFYPNKLFYKAKPKDIIVYSEDNIPINKKDIINGMFEKKIFINRKVSKLRSSLEYMNIKIPRNKSAAIGKEVVSVPRFTQTTEHLWLPSKEGAKFASSIEASSKDQVIAFLSSFIPKIGTLISLTWGLKILLDGIKASDIREYTNEGKNIEIIRTYTRYGKFFKVKVWNGNNIVLLKPVKKQGNHMNTIIKTSYSFK